MKSTRHVATLVFSSILLASLGCGSGSPSGPTGSSVGPIPEAQLAQRLAEELCKPIVACCAASGFTPVTQSVCVSAVLKDLKLPTGATYDENAAGLCVGSAQTAYSGCTALDDKAFERSCENVYNGTVPAGGACSKSTDCFKLAGAGASCVGTSSSGGPTTSKCVQNTIAADGAPCGEMGASYASCGNTSTCTSSGTSGSSVCKPKPAVGETCTGSCQIGAYCDFTVTKKCISKKPDGAKCESSSECSGGKCDAGACTKKLIVNATSCADIAAGKF